MHSKVLCNDDLTNLNHRVIAEGRMYLKGDMYLFYDPSKDLFMEFHASALGFCGDYEHYEAYRFPPYPELPLQMKDSQV